MAITSALTENSYTKIENIYKITDDEIKEAYDALDPEFIEVMKKSLEVVENKFTGNTTLGVVITNAEFNKTQLCKIAGMTHDGYARSIRPVHTSADGDSIFAVSVGDLKVDQDLVGTLAADVMSEAIIRAVTSAESAYGYPSANDIALS